MAHHQYFYVWVVSEGDNENCIGSSDRSCSPSKKNAFHLSTAKSMLTSFYLSSLCSDIDTTTTTYVLP